MKQAQISGGAPVISAGFVSGVFGALLTLIVFIWLILLWASFWVWRDRKRNPYLPIWAVDPFGFIAKRQGQSHHPPSVTSPQLALQIASSVD
jgi:hypothetical protein